MKKISSIVKTLVKKHWLIIFIVILALFLRLFKISSYMTFLGDEGRDALVWLRMTHGKLTLIGPQTSIGNMYLGPLFYYLMFPFYLILGTTGPSIGVALFAGATTFLLWKFGKEWFSERVGLISALLYAISPVAITLSRSSWNPNVMPFFSLLTVWGIWQFWQKEKYIWLLGCGVLISFAIQSHYLALLLVPVVGIFWLTKLMELIKSKDKKLNTYILYSVLCSLFFVLLTIGPLVWFDLRHNFINYKAFYKFFSERQTTVNLKPYKAIPEIWPLWKELTTNLVSAKNVVVGLWSSVLIGVFTTICFISVVIKKNLSKEKSFLLLITWIFIGLLGMGLYKQHIYDHYFGFLFPAVFLLIGFILDKIWTRKSVGAIFSLIIILVLVYFNLLNIPLKFSPNFQMDRTAEISKKIISESSGKPFNLGMVAKQNYDAGYRYFLEKWGRKAVEIDAQRANETITDQLFVVCEVQECNPTTSPQAEIANFGWSKIDKQWDFPWGVKLFKLVHYNNVQVK